MEVQAGSGLTRWWAELFLKSAGQGHSELFRRGLWQIPRFTAEKQWVLGSHAWSHLAV